MQSAPTQTNGSTATEDLAPDFRATIPASIGMNVTVEPASNAQQSPVAFTLSLIERLNELLDRETNGLNRHSIAELKELNHRKSQCLLELMRASRSLDGQPHSRALEARLGTLRLAADRNQAALQTHVDAVKEIAAIISDALRDFESDGTYDERPPARG